MMHITSVARFKRSVLSSGTGLVILSLAISAFAAPDDKPKTSGNTASQRVSSKAKTKKVRDGVAIKDGVLIKKKRIKKRILVDGKWVEIPEGGGPTPTPTPPPPPRQATGRRVKISARFVVTNSEDGFYPTFPPKSDNELELNGSISMGGQLAFSWSKKAAVSGKEFASYALNSVVLRYTDPNHRFFLVKGNIRDRDGGLSGKDGVWLASQNIDLIAIMQSNAEFVIKGDGKSESADLYIRVTDAGETFN